MTACQLTPETKQVAFRCHALDQERWESMPAMAWHGCQEPGPGRRRVPTLCEMGPVMPVYNTEKPLQTYQWLFGGPAETREKRQNLDHRAIREGVPHTHTYAVLPQSEVTTAPLRSLSRSLATATAGHQSPGTLAVPWRVVGPYWMQRHTTGLARIPTNRLSSKWEGLAVDTSGL